MNTTKSKGGRKALEPGELGKYTITGHKADGTVTTGTAHHYRARAWIGLPHGERKRVQVRADSKGDVRRALEARAAELVQADEDDHLAQQGGTAVPSTWRAAVLDHREYVTSATANGGRGYSAASKRVYLNAIDTYLLERSPFKDDRRLSTIGSDDLEHWLIGIANSTERKTEASGKGAERVERVGERRIGGEGAAKMVRSLVQGIFRRWCRGARNGTVRANPTSKLKFERSPELKRAEVSERKRGRAFTRAEVGRVLEAAYTDERCAGQDVGDLVRFLLATGCRVGEARALTWEHVHLEGRKGVRTGQLPSGHGRPAADDLAREFVTIAHTEDSSGKSEQARLARPKTDRAYRDVPLAAPMVAALRERRERMGNPGHEHPLILGEVGAVFPNGAGKLRDQSGLNILLRHLFDVAGVPWATSHTFRKTTVNLLSEDGQPVQRIAAFIGDTAETVTRHYLDDKTARGDMADIVGSAVFGDARAEKVDTEVGTEPVSTHLSIVKAG